MTNMPDDPATWIEYGREDLEMARRALQPPRTMPRSACFHAQQSAEKFLKAFLAWRRIAFPRTHDLEFLLGLCRAQDAAFAELAAACELLNEYGVPVRYPPEDGPVPEEPHAREALSLAERIATFVAVRIQP
jgi:HEPN domain-containing protein